MKTIKLGQLLLLCTLFFCLTSCGGDDVDCDDTAAVEARINNLLAALESSVDALESDPSTANCEAFVDAAEAAIDGLEDIGDEYDSCFDDGEKDEFDEQISDIRALMDEADC